jgi:AcrR family transcriptional regulator
MTTEPPKRRGRPPSGGREAILTSTLELLRERGIARLTTREIAERAGVSEASVFYHYTDRAGLLQAVFARGLEPLDAISARGIEGTDHVAVLTAVSGAIEHFLDQALPVMIAAQSDTELRDALAQYMEDGNLGPHRGVETLAAYFTVEQLAGRIRDDVDSAPVAMFVVASCIMRVLQRMLSGDDSRLPGIADTVGALETMLRAPAQS